MIVQRLYDWVVGCSSSFQEVSFFSSITDVCPTKCFMFHTVNAFCRRKNYLTGGETDIVKEGDGGGNVETFNIMYRNVIQMHD